MSRISLSILFVALTGMLMAQRIVYVNADAIGNLDGTSWTDAYVDLQQALSDACSDVPAQVWVSMSEYFPVVPVDPNLVTFTEKEVSFTLCNQVEMYGGFTGTETQLSERNWMINETILSGNIEHLSDRNGNSFNVIEIIGLDSTVIVDGFTIIQGESTEFGQQGIPPAAGGGIYMEEASPQILNCIFMYNRSHSGGGIFNKNSSPLIFNCTFLENDGEGAGIYNLFSNPVITSNSFKGNNAGAGGGIYNHGSHPEIIGCSFENNFTYYWGTIFNYASSPSITTCTFNNNMVTELGGGVYNIAESNPLITNCQFLNNRAGESGAGMYNSGSSPTVINCLFEGNKVNANFKDGGGMYNIDSNPIILNCTFHANEADDGGAMYNVRSNPVITGTMFSANTSLHGAALENNTNSVVTLDSCTFLENDAFYEGAAVYARFNASLFITNCNFFKNSSFDGPAIYIVSESSVRIERCTFSENKARDYGGAINLRQNSSPLISHCTFKDNTAGIAGGAISARNNSNASITNCSFIGNEAVGSIDTSGGAIFSTNASPLIVNCSFYNNNALLGSGISSADNAHPVITNCIMWDNEEEIYNADSSTTTITYSIVKGGYAGEGNLEGDPIFTDPENDDLTLQQKSPAINAGNPDTAGLIIPQTDLAGNIRIIYDTIDMGAYEYDGPLTNIHDPSRSDLTIFPNPTRGILHLMLEDKLGNSDLKVNVYQSDGSLVFSDMISGSNSKIILPDHLPNGIYICKIGDDHYYSVQSFTLMRP